MTPQRKHLADRILKLLALANSSTFAAEADTARKMAAELMEANDITELTAGKAPQNSIEWRDYMPFAKGMKWEWLIASELTELCQCCFLYHGSAYDDHSKEERGLIPERLFAFRLVGTIFNLDMLDYMLREVSRQRQAAWMNYKMQRQPDSFNKFCFGFARALADKIATILNRDDVAYHDNQRKLHDWYVANVEPITPGHLTVGKASSAAGLAAGKDASLHRGALNQPLKQIGSRLTST